MSTEVEELGRLCKAVELQLHRFRVEHGEPAYRAALGAWRDIAGRDLTVASSDGIALDALAVLEGMVNAHIQLEHALDLATAIAAGNLLFISVSEVIDRAGLRR